MKLLKVLSQELLEITADLMAGYIPDPGVIGHFKIQTVGGIDFDTAGIRQRIGAAAAWCRTFDCPGGS